MRLVSAVRTVVISAVMFALGPVANMSGALPEGAAALVGGGLAYAGSERRGVSCDARPAGSTAATSGG